MHLFGRTKELNLYCPSPLQEILEVQLEHSETDLNFRINYTFTDQVSDPVLFENKDLIVEMLPLDHQIFCKGFLFREKQKKHRIIKEKLPKGLSIADIAKLKEGEDILDEAGEIRYRSEAHTFPPRRSRSYAFCSDTRYNEDLLPHIKNVDLLYHEATFANDMKERAENTFHSTAEQAATIAQKAGAGKLLLGHYSVRYRDLDVLQEEARKVFPESYLAIEGSFIDIEE